MNTNIQYIFGGVIILFVIAFIFTYFYNDDVEKEYYENFLELDNKIKNL